MKKKLYLLLTLMLLTSMMFVACSSSEDVKDTQNTEKETETEEGKADKGGSTDWTTYEFSVNGKKLSLPCTYEDIKNASGFYMKPAEEKSFLGGATYTSVNLFHGDEKDLALYVNVTNLTNEDLQYTDCKITRIGQTDSMVADYGAAPVTFPGGLVIGQEVTIEKLTEMFGEPDDVYEWTSDTGDSWSNEYKWQEDESYSSRNYYEIKITDGVISELAINHIAE